MGHIDMAWNQAGDDEAVPWARKSELATLGRDTPAELERTLRYGVVNLDALFGAEVSDDPAPSKEGSE